MDYDHYYFKLEQMRNKAGADPNKMIRVSSPSILIPNPLSNHTLEPEQVPGVSDHSD